jgi:putative transposase
MPSPYGGFVKRVIDRFWILAIIESISRAILGYYISLNREYNANDVLLCVRNAIVPWKRRGLTIPGLKYPEHGGMPSEVIPELAWATWGEFSYDNAKANLAERVLKKLSRTVGCAINPGPVETPERRPFVERFYQTFEENGFHRLPSTTGSRPNDPRRNNPEKNAIRFDISLEHIEELTEVIVMQYNATPHSGIGYRTPLEYLQYFIGDENILVNTLPEGKRSNMNLLNIEASRIVRGNIKNGRRPYIEFEGARYQNDVLARTPDLIGKRLTLSIDPEDIRSLVAYLPDGSELGILSALGFWGRTPHTLEVRKAILALKHRRLIWYTTEQDPVQVYMDYLATQSPKSKAAAREFAKVQRMPKRGNNGPVQPVESRVEEPEDQPQTIRTTFTY